MHVHRSDILNTPTIQDYSNRQQGHHRDYTRLTQLLEVLLQLVEARRIYSNAKSKGSRGYQKHGVEYKRQLNIFYDLINEIRLANSDLLPREEPMPQLTEQFINFSEVRVGEIIDLLRDTAADQLYFANFFKTQIDIAAANKQPASSQSVSLEEPPSLICQEDRIKSARILLEKENPKLAGKIHAAQNALQSLQRKKAAAKRKQKCQKQGKSVFAGLAGAVVLMAVGRKAWHWGGRRLKGTINLSSDPFDETGTCSVDSGTKYWRVNSMNLLYEQDLDGDALKVSTLPEMWEILVKNKDSMTANLNGDEPTVFCNMALNFPQDPTIVPDYYTLHMNIAGSKASCTKDHVVNDAAVAMTGCMLQVLNGFTDAEQACIKDRTCQVRGLTRQKGLFWDACSAEVLEGTFPATTAQFEGQPPFSLLLVEEAQSDHHAQPGYELTLKS
jgi:hypothetical protein